MFNVQDITRAGKSTDAPTELGEVCVQGLCGPTASPMRRAKQSRTLQIHNGCTVSQGRVGRGNKHNAGVSQTTCRKAFSTTGPPVTLRVKQGSGETTAEGEEVCGLIRIS